MSELTWIDNICIPLDIFTAPFDCDLEECKGACCTIPGCYGAPLDSKELDVIQRALPFVLPFLPIRAQSIIAMNKWFERTPTGNLATATVDGNECIFAFTEDDIIRCALQRAYSMGLTDFVKPLSCHLFPLRQQNCGQGVYYERYTECIAAIARGKRTGTTVYATIRDALERAYGTAWIKKADALSMSITGVEEKCHD